MKTNEMKTVELADGTILKGPAILELSDTNIGWLDELEYDVWNLFCAYCEHLGITVEDESEPDWATVKAIQEFVFKQIEDAGILLSFAGANERFTKQLMNFQTSTEDTIYIYKEILPVANSIKWERLVVTDEITFLPEQQTQSLHHFGIVLHAVLPSGKVLLLYNFTFEDNNETIFIKTKTTGADDESNKQLRVHTEFGDIVAEELPDPEHKGVAVCFETKAGNIIDLALVEKHYDELTLYLYEEPWCEDYTTKSVICMKQIKKALEEDSTETFFFTYGDSETHPFHGGWTIVYANSLEEAEKKFQKKHPNKVSSLLNCAFVYTEEQFIKTGMIFSGNRGSFCHEVIC